MSSNSFFYIVLLMLFGASCVQAQDFSVSDDDFSKEITFGVSINTNGGLPSGLHFKYAKIKNSQTNITYGFEFVGIKHPKEQRVTDNSNNGGLPFTLYKENYLFSLRPQYGREGILFRKSKQEGVQVSALFAVGPSIGLIKPYMIFYNQVVSGQRIEEVPSRPLEQDLSQIYGRGSFFSGWGETDVAFGGHVKVGLTFEVSAFQKAITGVEVGFTHEMFDRTITIINNYGSEGAVNYNSFTSVYLMFFFGARK